MGKSKGFIEKRTKQLTDKEIEKFFSMHLPYRLIMLRTERHLKNNVEYQKLIPKREDDNIETLNGKIEVVSHEASKIAARMFMEFLGIKGEFLGIDKKGKKDFKLTEERGYKMQKKNGTPFSNEVKVVDLKGRWAELNDLSKDEQQILANLYVTVHKSTAHFTYKEEFGGEYENVEGAIIILEKLLKKCLYDETNRPFPID